MQPSGVTSNEPPYGSPLNRRQNISTLEANVKEFFQSFALSIGSRKQRGFA